MRVRAVFLYDGDCAFCTACANFIRRRVPTSARIQAWQLTDLDAVGLTAAECDEAVQWVSVDERGRRASASGPVAVAELMRSSAWYWRGLGRLLVTRPARVVSWPAYRWVARHRHRLPGGAAACALPSADRER